MTTVPLNHAAPKRLLLDRLFVGACTVAYIGLMASVVFALHLGG